MADTVDPIVVVQGDDVIWDVTLTDEDGSINLSGYTWVATWKSRPKSPSSIPIALDVSEVNVGKIVFHLTNEQTELMDRNGFWSLRGTRTSTGLTTTWLKGTTIHEPAVG